MKNKSNNQLRIEFITLNTHINKIKAKPSLEPWYDQSLTNALQDILNGVSSEMKRRLKLRNIN